VVSVFVQGYLLGTLLKKLPPQRLAVYGLLSSMLAYAAWGAASAGWMMYAVIFANLLGFTVASSIQSIVSSAADERSQGQTMGAVSSLNSLTAVMGPLIATPLLMAVSGLPKGHWEIGAPLYFGAALQGMALVLAWTHFRHQARHAPPSETVAPLPSP
jgi:DHA1 family tetracycline resistance protein-like MFS transporter